MKKILPLLMMSMIAAPAVLVVMARVDLGEDRFYGAVQTILIVIAMTVLGVIVGAGILLYVHEDGERRAKIEQARRWTGEVRTNTIHTHTIDGRGTFNVAGGDPLAYPDLVRQILAGQQPEQQGQLPAPTGYPVQLPAPGAQQAARPTVPATMPTDEINPYAGMADEW